MPFFTSWLPKKQVCLSSLSLIILGTGFFLPGISSCSHLHQPHGAGEQPDTQSLEAGLKKHVYHLAGTIGERNAYLPGTMEKSCSYLEKEWKDMGYGVNRHPVALGTERSFDKAAGQTVYNLEVLKPGSKQSAPVLVIGAHYDTRVGMPDWNKHGPVLAAKTGTPGANDNASGIAALLELSRALKNIPTQRPILFVAYANEEAPFFQTSSMGSLVHARSLKERKTPVLGMISLETLGCYSPRENKKRSSAVAAGLAGLPDRCDYVAFLSTNTGKNFSREAAGKFTANCRFPIRSAVFPYYTKGVAWSDDWAYMKQGIPSFAVTDTAFLRCDDYHETSDTPEKLDYHSFAEVTNGLIHMVQKLANEE